jgi:membrane-associated phospholipid phosphatase
MPGSVVTSAARVLPHGPGGLRRRRLAAGRRAVSGRAGLAPLLRLVGVLVLLAVPLARATASDGFTTYGDVARYALPAGAAVLAVAKDDRGGLTQFLASGAVTLGATYALKYAIDDTRPNGGRRSFPSGHTAWAFSGAAFIHHRYGWRWGLPAELAAAAVAVSRVDGDYHRWRDVIASAVIAPGAAFLLVDRLDRGVTLMPMFDGRTRAVGLAGTLKF